MQTQRFGAVDAVPLSASDHVQLLIELLRGATPDLARRWLAALLHVPAEEREALVGAMENRVLATYGDGPSAAEGLGEGLGEGQRMSVVYPAVQREGYVEQQIVEYEVETVKREKKRRRKAEGE